MQSLFPFPFFFLREITEIWFSYESYLQYAEYLLLPYRLSLLTGDGVEFPFNVASHISQKDEKLFKYISCLNTGLKGAGKMLQLFLMRQYVKEMMTKKDIHT